MDRRLGSRGVLAFALLVACSHDAPSSGPSGQNQAAEASATGRKRPSHRVYADRELAPNAPPRNLPAPAPALPEKLTRPARPVIVALGDLHGDLEATRRALRVAGAIDAEDHWVGGELTLVQTGDVLDRGDDDRALEDLLLSLHNEAAEAGGELIALSGNHELMNTMLSFGYVTSGGFSAFGGEAGRAQAFRPGGRYAQQLAAQPILIKIGDNVFVHGGILPEHIHYGLGRMNDEVQAFMRGELPNVPPALLDGNGLLWTRLYSNVPDKADCQDLTIALKALGAKRMIVGHTPQLGGITAACEGRVLRIDTGMSRFYGGPVEALEIQGDIVRVLKEAGRHGSPLLAP